MIVMPQAFDGDIASADGEPGLGASRIFRLSDAERIATDRLDGAAEGSLKEALATSIPVLEASSPRLVDRIEEIRWLTESVTPLRSFHAAPSALLGWEDAVPPAHAMPVASGEAAPEVRDQLADVPPPPSADAAWEQAWSAWKGSEEGAPLAPQTSREEMAGAGLHAQPEAMEASAAAVYAVAEPVEGGDVLLLPIAGGEPHGAVDAIAFEDRRAQVVAPIVTAYAENAKLAAEATAASHALHNLKLILTEKMAEDVTDLFGPERDAPNDPADRVDPADAGEAHAADAAGPVPPAELEVERSAECATSTDYAPTAAGVAAVAKGPPPLPSTAFVAAAAARPPAPSAPQPPLAPSRAEHGAPMPGEERADRRVPPRIAEVQSAPQRMAGAAAAGTAPKPAREAAKAGTARPGTVQTGRKKKAAPKVMRAARPDSVRTPLDVGGFMAGFALSGAIGVVLYFVMTAS